MGSMAGSSPPPLQISPPLHQHLSLHQQQQQLSSHPLPLHSPSMAQGFPLQAEYQSMVNVTSSGGPGLSPSMDYRTGCRNGPTQGLDWTSDYCGNGALQRDKALYLTWLTSSPTRSFMLTGPRQFLIPIQLFRAWLFRPYFRLDTIHASAKQCLNVFFPMAHTLVHRPWWVWNLYLLLASDIQTYFGSLK